MPKTTPLADEASIPAQLLRAGHTYISALRSALESAGYDDIPRNGHYVIAGLTRPGAKPLSQLIDELALPKQSAGQLVDSLVVCGYLSREIDPSDRRKFIISLTDRGRVAGRVLAKASGSIDIELAKRADAKDIETMRQVLSILADIGHSDSSAWSHDTANGRSSPAPRDIQPLSGVPMNILSTRDVLNVRDSNLAASRFATVNLSGSSFDDINLQQTAFVNVNFANCTFENVNMSQVAIQNANLSGMTINGIPVHDMLHAHAEKIASHTPESDQ